MIKNNIDNTLLARPPTPNGGSDRMVLAKLDLSMITNNISN